MKNGMGIYTGKKSATPIYHFINDMAFNFIQEYLTFNSGNECPRNFHLWTGLFLLSAATQKRIHIDLGYFKVYTNLYACLVGKQGSRKTTAKDIGSSLFTDAFPDFPLGSDVQSREDIIRFMASDECLYSYVNEENVMVEYRPYVVFVNELKNFLSVDIYKTIAFVTDIYDSTIFRSGTIKRGLEELKNPCVNILACETPEWITEKLKGQVISGGFTRRMIFVYETEEGPRIPFPTRPDDHKIMWKRLKNHLDKVSKIVGKFEWTVEAREFYARWYIDLKFPEDDMMAGYYRSKHIQAFKVAMLLGIAEEEPSLIMTKDRFELAVSMLEVLEPNMAKLAESSGQNKLAIPMRRAIDLVMASNGMISDKLLQSKLSKDLQPMEIFSVLKFLTETEQLVRAKVTDANKVERQMYMTKEKYNQLPKKP